MTQLSRIELGKTIEQAHMRNRHMVSKWSYDKGKAENVIEKLVKDGKTYFVVRDHQKLRKLFGELLREVQRIKSQGDYKAGKALIEGYGVQIDQALHKEILDRYEKLDVPRYYGFIQPKLVPQKKGKRIVDVKIEYPTDFTQQQLEYSEKYSFLPHYN